MPPKPSDPLLGAIVLLMATASIGAWFWLVDRLKQGPILPYEPRPPVPWHGAWTMLPVLLVAVTLFAALHGDGQAEDAAPATATDLIDRVALGSVQQMAFVVAFLAVMIAVSGATHTDLGLPKDRRQFLRDVWIGVVAWLAALAPVYGAQIVMISAVGPTEGHPLVKMVQEHASPVLYAMAFAAAVVVAPICEELLFRMLLQGWLEKWEDRRLGWRTPLAPPDEIYEVDDASEIAAGENLLVALVSPEIQDVAPAEPPRHGLGGLPYGWLPITISSLLFALAHFGYGPEPVPLFLLALILGYVYKRTHRIVPCMVTHALFNGLSLFALWRVTSAVAQ